VRVFQLRLTGCVSAIAAPVKVRVAMRGRAWPFLLLNATMQLLVVQEGGANTEDPNPNL